MNVLSDQAERDRFTSAHGRNISVIAPAGVGKTYAIVQRIVALAREREDLAVERLTRLVVVTYSVRAAQQMQQRARTAIRQAGVSARVQRAFQQTFFGTIHSYCVQLLERFGHYLGLSSPVDLLLSHDELWPRFLVRGLSAGTEAHFQDLFHFYPPEKLYALGKEISPGPETPLSPIPSIVIDRITAFPTEGLHHSTKRSLAAAQAAVQRWHDSWSKGDRFYPLPKCPETKATEFVETWIAAFTPLHEWLRDAALAFGRGVANAYETLRLGEAVMTYDDQVRIARRLLDHPDVRRELTQERPSVLLDEAQDTDPRQFEVLLRVAGLGPDATQAEGQSFCIVGDFQQAIYAPRSDLSFYRRVHDELILEPRGASSRLKVTFRCDEAIIRFVNKIFPSVLQGEGGQAAFFDLLPRDNAGPGQVARWLCPDEPAHAAGVKVKAEVRARHEAQCLAARIRDLGCAGLGASAWSQVAILCPRKNWLFQIERELNALGVPAQFRSSAETQHDRCAGAWLTALIWVAAHPEDSFEIAGVLREIFGVSDHNLALFIEKDGERLRLDRPAPSATGPVAEALEILREAAQHAESLPLHRLAQQLVAKTGLRARLNSILDQEPVGAGSDLDDLLAAISQRAASGATLNELAKELRRSLLQVSPVEEEVREAVQLLTSHKSKGLEWETVIVPYVFRPIETKLPPYPRLIQAEGGREMVLRDKADYATQAKSWVDERERHQLQRLLYVTCTRAKKTLLLVDDRTLFDGQVHRGGWSSAELLGLQGGVNRITWEALPETWTPMPLGDVKREEPPPPFDLAALSKKDLARAVRNAQAIPRRRTPHSLAVHRPLEAEPEERLEREEEQPGADHPGILYGTWWHEFVESIPWAESRETWQQHFAEALLRSPQRDRSEREWKLFLGSPLAQRLAAPGLLIQREIPFLLMEAKDDILEGVIDLAILAPGESAWQVIDWKTNRAAPSEEVVAIYRAQIEAYARALRQILSSEIKGSLYLTSTGQWVDVA
jgi:ATP-dependent exoDNAse (exonuclease V) beta subunit